MRERTRSALCPNGKVSHPRKLHHQLTKATSPPHYYFLQGRDKVYICMMSATQKIAVHSLSGKSPTPNISLPPQLLPPPATNPPPRPQKHDRRRPPQLPPQPQIPPNLHPNRHPAPLRLHRRNNRRPALLLRLGARLGSQQGLHFTSCRCLFCAEWRV
jgi:hypothetical protein